MIKAARQYRRRAVEVQPRKIEKAFHQLHGSIGRAHLARAILKIKQIGELIVVGIKCNSVLREDHFLNVRKLHVFKGDYADLSICMRDTDARKDVTEHEHANVATHAEVMRTIYSRELLSGAAKNFGGPVAEQREGNVAKPPHHFSRNVEAPPLDILAGRKESRIYLNHQR